jgi:predicted aminopeptidase
METTRRALLTILADEKADDTAFAIALALELATDSAREWEKRATNDADRMAYAERRAQFSAALDILAQALITNY